MTEPPVRPSWPVRAGIALAYLLAVNVLAGALAVSFRYPSLWGNEGGIFAEYAVPLPYGWAMAHWLTMLPLALVASVLPGWSHIRLLRVRWALVVLLALVLLVEVDWTYGKLNRIPFMLFFGVDFTLALLVSLAVRPPVRLLAGAAGAMAIAFAGVWWWMTPSPMGPESVTDGASPEPPTAPSRDATGMFSDSEVTVSRTDGLVRYTLFLADTVEPGRPPGPEAICRAAEARYAELAAVRVRPEGYRELVRFMAHPWFEPERKYVYPAGEAFMDGNGHWRCDFRYPEPAAGE